MSEPDRGRHERLEELKRAVRSGTYDVDARALAGALLDAGALERGALLEGDERSGARERKGGGGERAS